MEQDEIVQTLRSAPPVRLDVPVCRDLGSQVLIRDDTTDETVDDGNDSPGTLVGHFSTFGDWYEVNSFWEGHFIERIAAGSFKRTIKGRVGPGGPNAGGETPIRVLLDHGFDPQLGDKPIGVPELLEERAEGPYAEVPLFSGLDPLVVSGLRGGAYGQSFAFTVLRDEWIEEADAKGWEDPGKPQWANLPQRTIREVRLIEFGPTPFPANPGADAGLRSGTDFYYERLRRRDSAKVDQLFKRTAELRLPKASEQEPEATDTTDDEGTAPVKRVIPVPSNVKQDPPTEHSQTDPSEGHSGDSRKERHSEAAKRPTVADTPKPERNPVMDEETMTAEERSARQSEIRDRLREIDSEHNGAALPPEVQTEWDALEDEFDRHDAAILADSKRKRTIAKFAEKGDKATERASTLDGEPRRSRVDNPFDLMAIRQQARSIDEIPRLYRENALRVLDDARIHVPTERKQTAEDSKEQIRNLLDTVDFEEGWLARRILVTGSPVYQRAFGKMCIMQSTMGLTTEEQRALAVGATTTGGFAVPFQLDPTLILTQAGSVNTLRQLARVEQITSVTWQGLTTTGIVVTRAAEAAQAGDNAPTLAQPTVTPQRVQGFVPFSFEVDQDWAGLQGEMTRLLGDAKDQEEASSFLLGNGTPPAANGLLDATVGIPGASDVVANTVTAAAPYALEGALPVRWRNAGTAFLASKAIYNAIRQLDTQGGAQMWERIGAGQPAELLGYPAQENSNMPSNATPALNDRWLVLGDFKQFLIVDRMGMEVDLIPHLFGANFRPTGQRGIYAMWRNNSKVLVGDAFRVAKRTT